MTTGALGQTVATGCVGDDASYTGYVGRIVPLGEKLIPFFDVLQRRLFNESCRQKNNKKETRRSHDHDFPGWVMGYVRRVIILGPLFNLLCLKT